MADEKLMDRARDELFSHINRCGVLQADADDQRTWMDETIEYIAERYPDLSDADLQALYNIGIRFCQPAIAYGNPLQDGLNLGRRKSEEEVAEVTEETPEIAAEATEAATEEVTEEVGAV